MPDDQQSLGSSALLTAGVSSGATALPLSVAIGVADGRTMRVVCEGEVMLVTAGMGTTSLTVTRGQEGTTAAAHPSGATVQQRLTPAGLANTRTQPNPHAHNGSDGSGTVAHSATTGRTANDHHNQAHAIGGADHTGTLAHSALSGVGTNTHPAIDTHIADTSIHGGGGGGAPAAHATSHQPGGTDAISTAAAGASAAADTAAAGTATSLARSDHRHSREGFGSPVTQAFSDAAADGTATTVARSDHRHGMPASPGGGGSGLYSAVAILADEKAQNTNGGTFTSGAWRTRDLNTTRTDSGSSITLAANQFTPVAGTYDFEISCPAYYCDTHQARLYNATATVEVEQGTSEYVLAQVNGVQTRSIVLGTFTANGTDAYEVQHRCTTTKSTNGLGAAANLTTEVYTLVILRKRA